MKKCKRCKKTLEKTEFYKHAQMHDGLLSFCKSCTKSRVSSHREKNSERIRKYDRDRAGLQHRVDGRKDFHKRYKSDNPERIVANSAVNNAVRDGRLEKLPCEICGSEYRIHGHHSDYSKPLDVMWLCTIHHKEWHKNNDVI